MAEKADQGTASPPVISTIVTLPTEIDVSNAESVSRELCAAARPGTAVVIADMSQTQYCDSSAIRSLLLAHDSAVRNKAELRLVITSAAVSRILSVVGVDQLLHIYPSLGVALTSIPRQSSEPIL